MAYCTYAEYAAIYGSAGVSEGLFNALSWHADKIMDRETTGVDNFRKLRLAFPETEADVEDIVRTECSLIHAMYEVQQAEAAARSGVITREDGTVVSRHVTSVSSGSESISYGKTSSASVIDAAAGDEKAKSELYRSIISEGLSGTRDANGIMLLYMGVYPFV